MSVNVRRGPFTLMESMSILALASDKGTCSNMSPLVLTRYILKPKVRKEHSLLESKKEGEVQEPEPEDVSSLRQTG